jgi:hypothetical protein
VADVSFCQVELTTSLFFISDQSNGPCFPVPTSRKSLVTALATAPRSREACMIYTFCMSRLNSSPEVQAFSKHESGTILTDEPINFCRLEHDCKKTCHGVN